MSKKQSTPGKEEKRPTAEIDLANLNWLIECVDRIESEIATYPKSEISTFKKEDEDDIEYARLLLKSFLKRMKKKLEDAKEVGKDGQTANL